MQDKLNAGSLPLERVTYWIDLGLNEAVTAYKIANVEELAVGRAEDFVKFHLSAMLGLVLSDPPLVEAPPTFSVLHRDTAKHEAHIRARRGQPFNHGG